MARNRPEPQPQPRPEQQLPDGQELTDEQLDGVAGGTKPAPAAGSLHDIDSGVKVAIDL